jgi:DNA-binding NtrC family response regulator
MDVLFVDNDEKICQVIPDILKQAGLNVDTACDGKTALEKIKKQSYVVMILDHRFPSLYGYTVLERALKIDPKIKTVMVSDHGDPSTRSWAKKLGAYDFINKPFEIGMLINVVKKALNSADAKKVTFQV